MKDKPTSLPIELFDKRKDFKVIGIGFCICLVFGVSLYVLGKLYFNERTQQLRSVNARTNSSLENHDEAQRALMVAEASVAALRNEKIEDEELTRTLEALRQDFSKSNYSSVISLSDKIASMSSDIRMRDNELSASLSARLKDLEKKQDTYKKQGANVATLSASIASASAYISDKSYDNVVNLFTEIDMWLERLLAQKKEADRIAAEKAKLAAAAAPAPVAAVSNGGVTYERKVVNTSIGGFTADILTVDMGRVRVKTFTANENDCAADCPLKPLASYVGENGGIAGINGTYFCPADYSHCASVKNSFNTLVFDYRTKKYLNSAQNQYSVNPLISFYPGSAHFYTQALGYGRDTSAYGVISNHPTLVHNGGVATQVNLDAKSSGRGLRAGIGFRDKTLWAVVTRNATVPESGYVFTALGATYAMNLDGGGSTAMYFGGYKVGPGRQLPNAIVFTN